MERNELRRPHELRNCRMGTLLDLRTMNSHGTLQRAPFFWKKKPALSTQTAAKTQLQISRLSVIWSWNDIGVMFLVWCAVDWTLPLRIVHSLCKCVIPEAKKVGTEIMSSGGESQYIGEFSCNKESNHPDSHVSESSETRGRWQKHIESEEGLADACQTSEISGLLPIAEEPGGLWRITGERFNSLSTNFRL